MTRIALAFIALSALAAVYHTAVHANGMAALQLAVMGVLGFIAGRLWEYERHAS